jgi:hypothetical protein
MLFMSIHTNKITWELGVDVLGTVDSIIHIITVPSALL